MLERNRFNLKRFRSSATARKPAGRRCRAPSWSASSTHRIPPIATDSAPDRPAVAVRWGRCCLPTPPGWRLFPCSCRPGRIIILVTLDGAVRTRARPITIAAAAIAAALLLDGPRIRPSILNWAEAWVGCSSKRPDTNAKPAAFQIEDLPIPCIAVSRSNEQPFPVYAADTAR